MITNASISRYDAAPARDHAGRETYTEGDAIAVRAALTQVNQRQRVELAVRIEDASAVVYVLRNGLSFVPEKDGRLVITLDGDTAETYRIAHVGKRFKPGRLDHYELFLQEVV